MEHWVDVGAIDDFQEGLIRLITALGIEVGVARSRDHFYAMRNVCPHTGAPVCLGRLGPLLTAGGTPWELEIEQNRVVVSCPWHFWEFDVMTGKAIVHPRMHLKTYPTAAKEGRVLIKMRTSAGASSTAPG